MSNDDIVKALENVTLPQDNSDEVTRLKNAKDKATAEAAEYKRKLKDHMSEEEKRATEEAERIKAIETENEALRKSHKTVHVIRSRRRDIRNVCGSSLYRRYDYCHWRIYNETGIHQR